MNKRIIVENPIRLPYFEQEGCKISFLNWMIHLLKNNK